MIQYCYYILACHTNCWILFCPLVMLDSGRSNVSSSSGNVGGAGGRAGSGPPSRESSRLRSGGGSLSGTNVSSSSSIGMPSVGSVSSSQPSPVPPPAAVVTPSAPLMSEDEAERKTKTIIMEWLDNNNIQVSSPC